MKKIIFISIFFGCSHFIMAQSSVLNDVKIEIKPISFHLYKQKTPFTRNSINTVWNTYNYIPVIKNHPFGDYSYNYLNPNNTNTAGGAVAFGLINYFLDQTINKK